MTQWIITSSLLIVAVLLIRIVGRDKLSARLRYALWALVLLRLLLPFSVGESVLSVQNLLEKSVSAEVRTEPTLMSDVIETSQTSETIEIPAVSEFDEETNRTVINAPALVWGIGTFITGAVFIISNLRFAGKLRRNRSKVMDHSVSVYVTEAVETPCLFGFMRPAVYVTPEVWADETALRHVLAHELTHYRHGDHLWSLLRCVAVTIHWYNPLVWMAAVLSQKDGELACDEGALCKLGNEERTDYARTLLSLSCVGYKGMLTAATSMTGSESDLKTRIKRIAANPKMTAAAVIAVAAAMLLTGCVVFTDAKTPAIEGVWCMEITVLGEGVAEEATAYMEYEFFDCYGRRIDVIEGEIRSAENFTYTITNESIVLNFSDTGMEREYTWSVNGDTLTLADYRAEQQLTAVERKSVPYLPDGYWAPDSVVVSYPGGSVYANLTDTQQVQLFALLRQGASEKTRKEVMDNTPYMLNIITAQHGITISNGLVYEQGPNGAEEGYELTNLEAVEAWLGTLAWNGAINDRMETSGFTPEELSGIVDARMILYGKAYYADSARLAFLEELLTTAEDMGYPTACPFEGILEVTLSDGRVLGVVPALDSCSVFKIGDTCYEYGNQFAYDDEGSYDNSALLDIFGLNDTVIEQMWAEARQNQQGEVIGTMSDIGDVVRIRESDGMMEPTVLSDEARERMIALLAEGVGDAIGEEEMTCEDVSHTIISSGLDPAEDFVTLSDNGSLYMDGVRYELHNANALLQLLDAQFGVRIAHDGYVVENVVNGVEGNWYGTVGEEVYFELQGVLEHGTVTWSSSDEGVCTVVGDANGATVTFTGIGKARITAEWKSNWNTKGYTFEVQCGES